MNYEKLYNSFIANRRKKENSLPKTCYTETHHIVPKCMGGSDHKENLIRLIPEDHFFAHLLLAKAFGGKNWMALHSMLHRGMKTEEIKYKDFANKRKNFGFIRRLVANSLKGKNNPQADLSVYLLKHRDGRSVTGDRVQLNESTGLSSRLIGKLVQGKINTAHYWYSPDFNPDGLTTKEKREAERRVKETVKLFHFDGRVWSGTSSDFYKEFNKQLLFSSDKGMCAGWFRDKKLAEDYLNNRSGNKKTARRIYEFEIIETGEIVYHSKATFSKTFGVSKNKVDELLLGKIRRLKGIRLLPRNDISKKPNSTHYKFVFLDTKETYKLSIPEMSKRFNIPSHRLYQLAKGKVKVAKKYGLALVN